MVWVRERLGAERVSERRACQVLGQARSTQRRERHIPDDEARLVAEMVELATHYGRYGYRRITAMLRWEGWKERWTPSVGPLGGISKVDSAVLVAASKGNSERGRA